MTVCSFHGPPVALLGPVEMHGEDLAENWQLLSEGKKPNNIQPLE